MITEAIVHEKDRFVDKVHKKINKVSSIMKGIRTIHRETQDIFDKDSVVAAKQKIDYITEVKDGKSMILGKRP